MRFIKTNINYCSLDLTHAIIMCMHKISSAANGHLNKEHHKYSLLENSNNSSKAVLSRRGLERLDMLLLVIEALDLNGSQAMLWTSQSLGLQSQFPNSVSIWKCRCHNPLRKTTRRGSLKPSDTDALILLICTMSERLYPRLRQLISTKEPVEQNQERWRILTERVVDLIEERFNMRRNSVKRLINQNYSMYITRQYVKTLALSVGNSGADRLKASLLDCNL